MIQDVDKGVDPNNTIRIGYSYRDNTLKALTEKVPTTVAVAVHTIILSKTIVDCPVWNTS